MPLLAVLTAIAVVIATFPHASDFATAYLVVAVFTLIPLVVAVVMRTTRVWWLPGSCVIALAILGLPTAVSPYAASDVALHWILIALLYAAFGMLLCSRKTLRTGQVRVDGNLADRRGRMLR